MADDRSTTLLVAFGLGLVAGAAAGLLLAPASGEETRKRVRDASGRALERARKSAERTREVVGDKVHEAQEMLQEGTERARRTAGDLERRVETAFKEGREAFLRESP
jgi:gas vesicle protein